MNDNCQDNKIRLRYFERTESSLNTSLLSEKWGVGSKFTSKVA